MSLSSFAQNLVTQFLEVILGPPQAMQSGGSTVRATITGSHLRTLALKTENLSKKIGRLVKRENMDLLKSSVFQGFLPRG